MINLFCRREILTIISELKMFTQKRKRKKWTLALTHGSLHEDSITYVFLLH